MGFRQVAVVMMNSPLVQTLYWLIGIKVDLLVAALLLVELDGALGWDF